MAHIEDVEVSSYHFGNGKLFVKRENGTLVDICDVESVMFKPSQSVDGGMSWTTTRIEIETPRGMVLIEIYSSVGIK